METPKKEVVKSRSEQRCPFCHRTIIVVIDPEKFMDELRVLSHPEVSDVDQIPLSI